VPASNRGEGDGGVDPETATRLRRVVSRLARQLNSESTSEGLTPSQASVLGQIVTHGPVGIAELTTLEMLNPTMLSRVIGKLDQAGLIRRRANPEDLRAALVESTPAGKRLHRRIRDKRTSAVSAGVDALPPQQLQALVDALPALEALVSELQER
jgi:DNA-binding MarR family transcriptional regulator